MQFVQEYDVLEPGLQNAICDYMRADKRPFDESLIYDSVTEIKSVAMDERVSSYKTFVDEKLFNLCGKYIDIINQRNKYIHYILCKNDVTYIKYEKGGYFKSHEDYLSLTSNMMEEYTLLMCVDANCIGGETMLHINDFFHHASKSSITPLNSLIFRKDIIHEGIIIKEGYKEIMTLNLWGISKNNNMVVVISFDKYFKNDTRKYVIPVDNILKLQDNLLKTFINFTLTENPKQQILVFDSSYSYEEFNIIYKIYNNNVVNNSEFEKYKPIIDFYLFNWKNLLIKNLLNIERVIDNEYLPISKNEDLILFGDNNSYVVFLDNVKKSLLPYMPFQMILIEGGHLNFEGWSDREPEQISMQPVCMSFSEKNNIYEICNIIKGTDLTSINYFDKLKENSELDDGVSVYNSAKKSYDKFVKSANNDKLLLFGNAYDEYECTAITLADEDLYTFNSTRLFFDLKVCLDYTFSLVDLIDLIIGDDNPIKVCKCDYPMIDVEDSDSDSDSESDKFKIVQYNKYYYIDDENELAITPSHFPMILGKMKQINLYQTVISKLNDINFNLPQQTKNLNHFFCNESVYGNFTFLTVYGFMKME